MALSFDAVDDSKQWYRPKVPGNTDPDDPNPFAVLISVMSAKEMRKLGRANGKFTKGLDDFVAQAQAMEQQIIKDHVHAVRGFNVGDKEPTNGAELLESLAKVPARAYELILSDIIDAIKDASVLRDGLLDRPGPSSES